MRVFPRPKILRYTLYFQCVQNSIFPSGKHIFPISYNSYTRCNGISHSFIKFEISTALFYINYSILFSAVNLYFPNSSIDLKFWVMVLDCTSKFFPIDKEILGFLCCSSWTPQFFPIHQKANHKKRKIFFWINAQVTLQNFSQITKELWNWDFWNLTDFTFC